MITDAVHFISMRTKTAWGNTLSLHRERLRAVCLFVYAVAFGHFLPALPLPSHEDGALCRRKQQSRGEAGGGKHRYTGRQKQRSNPLVYVMQNQVHSTVRAHTSSEYSDVHHRKIFSSAVLSLSVQLELLYDIIRCAAETVSIYRLSSNVNLETFVFYRFLYYCFLSVSIVATVGFTLDTGDP